MSLKEVLKFVVVSSEQISKDRDKSRREVIAYLSFLLQCMLWVIIQLSFNISTSLLQIEEEPFKKKTIMLGEEREIHHN